MLIECIAGTISEHKCSTAIHRLRRLQSKLQRVLPRPMQPQLIRVTGGLLYHVPLATCHHPCSVRSQKLAPHNCKVDNCQLIMRCTDHFSATLWQGAQRCGISRFKRGSISDTLMLVQKFRRSFALKYEIFRFATDPKVENSHSTGTYPLTQNYYLRKIILKYLFLKNYESHA